MNQIQMIGLRFGRLKVLETAGKTKKYEILYKCLCDCGNTTNVRGYSLRRGNTISCGCFNLEQCVKSNRKGIDAVYNDLFSRYRKSAKKRNIKFEMIIEKFKTLIHENCFYCGVSPSAYFNKYWTKEGTPKSNTRRYDDAYTKGMTLIYNGVDRIDNKEGYEENNIVACCFVCNRAKLDMSYEDFIIWIKRLVRKNTCS